MKLKYTVGSRIHKALDALKICPKEPADLRKTIDFQGSLPQMMDTVITPAIFDGLIAKNDGMLSLTQKGVDKLAQLGSIKKPLKSVSKVSKMDGTYAGNELKRLSVRPGAYDFLECPSLIGDRRYERENREANRP